jgi:hypothetical protein
MWYKVVSRKRFFATFALQNGFDPRIAENWYTQPKGKIMAMKVQTLFCYIFFMLTQGARGVLAYHGQSLSRALLDLFPDIGLDKKKFSARKCTSFIIP